MPLTGATEVCRTPPGADRRVALSVCLMADTSTTMIRHTIGLLFCHIGCPVRCICSQGLLWPPALEEGQSLVAGVSLQTPSLPVHDLCLRGPKQRFLGHLAPKMAGLPVQRGVRPSTERRTTGFSSVKQLSTALLEFCGALPKLTSRKLEWNCQQRSLLRRATAHRANVISRR